MKPMYVKSVGVGLLCALALLGCNKTDDKKDKGEQAPPVTKISDLSCDDASIKNALVKELTSMVETQIEGAVSDFPNADDLDLETRIKQRLPDIAVDLQNVQSQDKACTTELHITLPSTDIGYANRYFKANDLPSVSEQTQRDGVQFRDGTFISPITYKIEGGDVKLDGTPTILSLVAQTASAGTYANATSKAPRNDKADKTERTKTSANTNSEHAPAVRPRPTKPVETNTPAPKPNKPASGETSTNTVPKAETPKAEKVDKSESQRTGQEMRSEPKPEPKSEPKAEPKPEPKSTPKETVKDTTSEITIVELDETY